MTVARGVGGDGEGVMGSNVVRADQPFDSSSEGMAWMSTGMNA